MIRGCARAVVLDFFGTLARATTSGGHRRDPRPPRSHHPRAPGGDVVERRHRRQRARRAVTLPRPLRGVAAGAPGRDAARGRRAPGEHDAILTDLHEGRAVRVLEAYDEVPAVLDELREPGPHARGLLELGLGSRAGHRRDRARRAGSTPRVVGVGGRAQTAPADLPVPARAVGLDPAEVLFVGDTWGPDVEGPLAAGMTPAYLERDGHWPDDDRGRDDGRTIAVARRARPPRAAPAGGSRLNAARSGLRTGCVRRRGRSGLLRPCGRGRRRTRRADPLPGCGSREPWMAEKWTNTSGPSSREMKP